MRLLGVLASFAILVFSAQARAQVDVHAPWVRSTVPGQKVGAAYMEIRTSEPVTLVRVSSPAAPSVQLHETREEAGIMKMREVPRIAVPAGGALVLKPGGYHLMLMGLAKPLKAGDAVPLTLVFEAAGGKRISVQVNAPVRDVMGGSGHGSH